MRSGNRLNNAARDVEPNGSLDLLRHESSDAVCHDRKRIPSRHPSADPHTKGVQPLLSKAVGKLEDKPATDDLKDDDPSTRFFLFLVRATFTNSCFPLALATSSSFGIASALAFLRGLAFSALVGLLASVVFFFAATVLLLDGRRLVYQAGGIGGEPKAQIGHSPTTFLESQAWFDQPKIRPLTAALACLLCGPLGDCAYSSAIPASSATSTKVQVDMPRTVDEGFRDFLASLTPTDSESEAAKRHRASIKSSLENNFDIRTFFRIGSFGNGTSISGHSDVDYIASLNPNMVPKPDDSENTLRKVRDALDTTFPRTGVRVNCPAIRLPFGTDAKETTEVVPAYYLRKDGEYRVYDIADCSGGWMRSSPDAHNDYVRSIDEKLGGKVKPLIRFIKAWKCFQNVPIASFYLELRVAKYADKEDSIIYDIDIRRVLEMLQNVQLAHMQDPKGISGYIKPCSTEQKLEDAKSKLATAVTRAQKASDAKKQGNIAEAFEWWSKLFGERFPSYYR